MPKGRKGRRGSKRLAKNSQKMMNSSCMWGGDSAVTGLAGSGATGYGTAIYGAANAQTNDGMGSNHIKLADPAVAWKGGQRGGGETVIPPGATNVRITWDDAPTDATADAAPNTSIGGSRGGSMLGAAIVPAALLAANQLYKPSRALKNLSFSRKNGFSKTMKKFRKGRR